MHVEVLSQKSEVISLTKPNIFLLLVSCTVRVGNHEKY